MTAPVPAMPSGDGKTRQDVGTKREPVWVVPFLMMLRECGNVGRSAEIAGISRSHVYLYRDQNPSFAERWGEAMNDALDKVELSLFERATKGTERLKFDKRGDALIDPRTQEFYVEREYDTTAGIFYLKKRRPEIFGDRPAVSINFVIKDAEQITERLGLDSKETLEGVYRALAGESIELPPPASPSSE